MLISVCVWIASFGDLFKHIYTVEFCVSFRRHSRSVDIQTVIPLHCHLHPCTECELCYLLRIVVVNNKFRSIWCEDRVTVSARQNSFRINQKKKLGIVVIYAILLSLPVAYRTNPKPPSAIEKTIRETSEQIVSQYLPLFAYVFSRLILTDNNVVDCLFNFLWFAD